MIQLSDSYKRPELIPEDIDKRRIENFIFNVGLFDKKIPINKNWKGMEIGAGKYGWADLYQDIMPNFTCLDIADFSAYHPTVKHFTMDITASIPQELKDSKFDYICSHSVLEHVSDPLIALFNINRLLRLGGLTYITIHPLYYSSGGHHLRDKPSWSHLDRNSDMFMMHTPINGIGHYLNKLTASEFLSYVGRIGWEILWYSPQINEDDVPEDIKKMFPLPDLYTGGFRFIGYKISEVEML